jgi:ADP-heptose:LPS heptosyltransferase
VDVIVLHLNQIGDFCFGLPIAAAIKQHYRDSRVCSVVRRHLVPLAQRAQPVDEVVVRPTGMSGGYWSLIRRLRARRADLAVVLSTSPGAQFVARTCGAARVVGFDHKWAAWLLREKVPYTGVPSLANNLHMAEYLTGRADKRDYVGLLAATDEDRASADSLLAARGVPSDQPLVVLAMYGSVGRSWKCWPQDRFARVADMLCEQAGLTPVFVGGSADADSTAAVLDNIAVPAVNLAGQTDTGQLLGLLARATVFIGQDTGPTHLSAALGRPTLALFGPTDPRLTGPLGDSSRVIYRNLPCGPCHKYGARCLHRKCLMSIEPDEVAAEALDLAAASGLVQRPRAVESH